MTFTDVMLKMFNKLQETKAQSEGHKKSMRVEKRKLHSQVTEMKVK